MYPAAAGGRFWAKTTLFAQNRAGRGRSPDPALLSSPADSRWQASGIGGSADAGMRLGSETRAGIVGPA